tara:strand:- start:2646 stop:2912 length:267 start_codon:yes stop_codon:yes gene_type:complete
MGEVVKLHNHVVLDQDLISKVWAMVNFLRKGGESSLPLRNDAEILAEILALKMYDQNCGLSNEFAEQEEILDEWASPIRERIHNPIGE